MGKKQENIFICFHKAEEIIFKRVKNDVENPSTENVGKVETGEKNRIELYK